MASTDGLLAAVWGGHMAQAGADGSLPSIRRTNYRPADMKRLSEPYTYDDTWAQAALLCSWRAHLGIDLGWLWRP